MGSGCWTRWQREGKEQEDGLGVQAHRDDTGPWRPVTEFLLWSLVMGRVGTDGIHLILGVYFLPQYSLKEKQEEGGSCSQQRGQ